MNLHGPVEWLGRLPVKVLRGLARGAWWSTFPCSSYWRLGGNDSQVEAALRRHALRPGGVFWDIGAHHGIYAVGVARQLGASGRVEAFEPDPVSCRRLEWHRRLNRLENLHIHSVAASDHSGRARIYHYNQPGATTTHLPYPGEPTQGAAYWEVETAALDRWVADGRLLPPHFIKLDVEGHGDAALAGMKNTLRQQLPGLIVGIHHEPEYRAVQEILGPLAYTFQILGDSKKLTSTFFGELLCLPPTA